MRVGVCHVSQTKGIIIKTIDYGESDKIITILNEHGAKVPLMARRAKRIRVGYKRIHNASFMDSLSFLVGKAWEH